jgi:hypothetical protein
LHLERIHINNGDNSTRHFLLQLLEYEGRNHKDVD